MPAIPGRRISPISGGPSKFAWAGHDGQSRFVNEILQSSDAPPPPGFDYKIPSIGNFTLAGDGISHVKVG